MAGTAEGGELVLRGRNASYEGVKGGLEYQPRIKILHEGGEVRSGRDTLEVMRADAVTLLVAAHTNFVNYRDVSADAEALTKATLSKAAVKSYGRLRDDHVREHRRLFRRASLRFGKDTAPDLPVDERIRRFGEERDPQLAALFFQFGCYLLISSSRSGSLASQPSGHLERQPESGLGGNTRRTSTWR